MKAIFALSVLPALILGANIPQPAEAATVKTAAVEVCGVTYSYVVTDITKASKAVQAADLTKTVKALAPVCKFTAVAPFSKAGASLYAVPKAGRKGSNLQSFYNKLTVAEIKAAIKAAGGQLM